jgi:MYXO-CTERM domain-containing protein
MEPTATTGETSKRVLAPDDVDAVCTLYPAGGATLTRCAPAVAPPSQTPSGCGCSLSEGGVSTALLVAALLAWSRRRRP